MFELHPQLAADCSLVEDWPVCRVLLMNDRRFPWLVLVPRRPDLRDLHDATREDRLAIVEEAARASAALKRAFRAHKTNVAALGNLVPQLHVHVIARQTDDAAWPRPVWGVGTAEPYAPEARAEAMARFRAALA